MLPAFGTKCDKLIFAVSWFHRNVAHGPLLAGMRPRRYLKLAKLYGELREQARDNASRNQLATLEHSYLTLAESSQLLRRSVRLQKLLEKSHRKQNRLSSHPPSPEGGLGRGQERGEVKRPS